MDFDSILPHVGGFGRYQKFVIICVLLPAAIPCAFHAYSQLFIASRPDHWCAVPELYKWYSEYPEILKNLSIPFEYRDGSFRHSECRVYVRNYSEISRNIETNGSEFLNELLTAGQNLTTTDCKNGWIYERHLFESTVITQVYWAKLQPFSNVVIKYGL
jgi:hypothetical protein